MKQTEKLGLNLPESEDFYDVEHMNQNTKIIEQELMTRASGKGLNFFVDENGILNVTYDDGKGE